MSLFSNDMRVANTATPSFAKEANVGQFGWTSADAAQYNQLIQYVDECRKIWINLQEKIDYVENILEDVKDVDAQVDTVNRAAASAQQDRIETSAYRDQVFNMYKEWKPLNDQFQIDYVDFSRKYTLVTQMHAETLEAAIAAAQSESNAANSAKEAADIAEELRRGQVYRGTWNIEANAGYPTAPDTNSVWDVVLNEGSTEYNFDSKKWFWGDRLLYLKDDNAFSQIESGSGVLSVNGKAGAVTLDYMDVNAAPTGFGLGTGGETLSGKSANDASGSGFYSVYSGTTETPYSSGGPSGSQIMHMEWGGGAGATQLFSAYTSDRIHFRRKYQDVWKDWFEIYHTGKKPTPNEIGAVSKSGDTMSGGLIMSAGASPLTLNNNYLMGANNAITLRDHGNGNVTLSGGVNSSGAAGALMLGYNGTQTGTAGYNTSTVSLQVPLTWKSSTTLINSAGKIPADATEGLLATSGGTLSGPLYWADNNKYVNASGSNLYVAAKTGRVYIEGNSTPIARVAGVDYNIYHQGFKPTAADVGAVGLTGNSSITGNLTVNGEITSAKGLTITGTGNIQAMTGGYLRSNTDSVMALDGKVYSFVTSPKDAHLCANAYWNGASWQKYNAANASMYAVVNDQGQFRLRASSATSTDPNELDTLIIDRTGNANFRGSVNCAGLVSSSGTESTYHQIRNTGNPALEFHHTGESAAMIYKPQNTSAVRFCQSNGAGGEAYGYGYVDINGFWTLNGRFASAYVAADRGWTGIGQNHFHGLPANVGGPGTLYGLVGKQVNYPGHWSLEQYYGNWVGTHNANDLAHTFVSTDGGGYLRQWFMYNDGRLQSPSTHAVHWNMLGDGNLMGSAFGGYGGIVAWCNASFAPASDGRLKTILGDSTKSALDIVDQFRFKKFAWNEEAGEVYTTRSKKVTDIGLIAQEVEDIDSNFVKDIKTVGENGVDVKALDTASLLAVALKAIQELKAEIAELKASK